MSVLEPRYQYDPPARSRCGPPIAALRTTATVRLRAAETSSGVRRRRALPQAVAARDPAGMLGSLKGAPRAARFGCASPPRLWPRAERSPRSRARLEHAHALRHVFATIHRNRTSSIPRTPRASVAKASAARRRDVLAALRPATLSSNAAPQQIPSARASPTRSSQRQKGGPVGAPAQRRLGLPATRDRDGRTDVCLPVRERVAGEPAGHLLTGPIARSIVTRTPFFRRNWIRRAPACVGELPLCRRHSHSLIARGSVARPRPAARAPIEARIPRRVALRDRRYSSLHCVRAPDNHGAANLSAPIPVPVSRDFPHTASERAQSPQCGRVAHH